LFSGASLLSCGRMVPIPPNAPKCKSTNVVHKSRAQTNGWGLKSKDIELHTWRRTWKNLEGKNRKKGKRGSQTKAKPSYFMWTFFGSSSDSLIPILELAAVHPRFFSFQLQPPLHTLWALKIQVAAIFRWRLQMEAAEIRLALGFSLGFGPPGFGLSHP